MLMSQTCTNTQVYERSKVTTGDHFIYEDSEINAFYACPKFIIVYLFHFLNNNCTFNFKHQSLPHVNSNTIATYQFLDPTITSDERCYECINVSLCWIIETKKKSRPKISRTQLYVDFKIKL
jgi:hypothetical protein